MSSGDATSSSLLRRAEARDPAAWQRIVNLYSPLIRHWCRQARVSEHDFADVSQEIFAVVAAKLAKFQSDRPGTTFRGWVRGIALHKLQHHARQRHQPAIGGTDAQNRLQQIPAPVDGTEVSLSESPRDVAELYRRALKQVQHQFEERTWSAFWQVTVESRLPADVAAELGITANAVRQAKSRVLRRLKEEMGEIIT